MVLASRALSRALPLIAATALAAPALAQVMGLPPGYLPVQHPKYYSAVDLGRVAVGVPVGCLSRNGALYLNRHQRYNVSGPSSQAVIGYGSNAYPLVSNATRPSWVTACNDRQEAAGVLSGTGGLVWDVQWSQPQQLGQTFVDNVQVTGMNNARQLAVIANGAARWDTSTVPDDNRITVRYFSATYATGINAAGAVTADMAYGSNSQRHAMLFPAGQTTGVPLNLPDAVWSWSAGIDDQSRVVGGLQDAAGLRRGYLWHATEGYQPLAPAAWGPTPLQHADALAIGLERTVVGVSFNGDQGSPTATLWFRAGRARNLNHEAQMASGAALPRLTRAVAISDAGAILCEAIDSLGDRRAVLLSPQAGGRWSYQLP